MKILKSMSLILFLFVLFLSAQDREVEYRKAMDRFDNGKELYFSFYRNLSIPLEDIDRVVSLDKLYNDKVYAYAFNKEKFEEFLTFNHTYQVETHPSELFSVECSDFSDFKTSDAIDKYPTYDGYQNILKQFQTEYPKLCKVIDVGVTEKDRKVLGLVITGEKKIPKPRALWLGAIHGDELTGTMCAFKMFQYLMEKYASGDTRVTRILDSIEIWTVPFENLDGTYAGGNNTVNGAKRSNANGVDLNRSFDCPPGIKKAGKEQQETRNIYKLLKENKFTIGADSHGGIECYIYPWCCQQKQHPQRAMYRVIGDFLVNKTEGGIASGIGNAMETVGYLAKGCQADHLDYYGEMVGWTFEMSRTKKIQESQFNKYWDKFREMMLSYYELSLTGIQGLITDSTNGKGIDNVVVTVEGESEKYLTRYSYNSGFYCRMIKAGTHTLKFTHKDYHPRTITGVKSVDLKKTALSLKMYPLVTKTNNIAFNPVSKLGISQKNSGITFTWNGDRGFSKASVYAINGTLVQSFNPQSSKNQSITWNGYTLKGKKAAQGGYFISFTVNGLQVTKRFMVTN